MKQFSNNESALMDFVHDVHKTFYYFGDEDDGVTRKTLKSFDQLCTKFINKLQKDFTSAHHTHKNA